MTLNTRQMRFEPLGASDLFSPDLPTTMTREETIQAVASMLEQQKELRNSSQKMTDPDFNKLDANQWAAIHADDERVIATLTAALHWLN